MNACIVVGISTHLVGIRWCILNIRHYHPYILVEVACLELGHLLLLLLLELTHLLLPLQQGLPWHLLVNVVETFSVQELRHAVQWETNWYDWSESSWLCQEESGDLIRLSCGDALILLSVLLQLFLCLPPVVA
jgi:hypothetical protein